MSKAMLLLTGAILCRGERTVYAALKIFGMQGEEHFDKYHRVLSRVRLVLLKGIEEEYKPIGLMGVDALFQLTAIEIIEWFVAR